jgi:hypothetical protein
MVKWGDDAREGAPLLVGSEGRRRRLVVRIWLGGEFSIKPLLSRYSNRRDGGNGL